MQTTLDHDGVVAALQGRLGDYWTVTVRSARPGAPLIAMFSGALQKAEPEDDAEPGETDYVWYVGTDSRTFGAFAIPREGFGFSRNPAIRMGPPRFEETRFHVEEEAVAQSVRIRYIL